jgi:hypothetical protein
MLTFKIFFLNFSFFFPSLNEGQKLMKLKQKMSILSAQIELTKSKNNSVSTTTVVARDQVKQDVENILAAES